MQVKVFGKMVKALESEEVSVLAKGLLRVCRKGKALTVWSEYCVLRKSLWKNID